MIERKNEGQNPQNEVAAQIARIAGEMKSALEAQAVEVKAAGSASAETAALVSELKSKLAALEASVAASSRVAPVAAEEVKSAGQQLIESGAIKSAIDRGGAIQTGRISIKAAVMTGAQAVGVVRNDRAAYVAAPTEGLVRPLFSSATTTSNGVEFPQVKAWTNNAAGVADGALKPESELELEVKDFKIRTIAHLMRVHKNILSDEPALQGIIDTQMLSGLADKIDAELIAGDGTGEHLSGLIANARPFTRAQPGDSKADVLRRAITDLRLRNYTATAMIVNPLDLEDIELAKDSTGRYVNVNATDASGVTRVWRVRVVDSARVAEGQFIMGDFSKAIVFDRQQTTLEVFEQDRDNVARNLITIRVEARLALVTTDQNAFVVGSYDADI